MLSRRPLRACVGAMILVAALAGCGAAAPLSSGAQPVPSATAALLPDGAATAAPAPLATPSPAAPTGAAPTATAGAATAVATATGGATAVAQAPTGAAAAPALAPTVQTAVAETGFMVSQEIMDGMVADLTQRVGGDPSRFTITTMEAVSWSDGSLGCPRPGMMYPQVITEGFRVVFTVDGKEYAYHGNDRGNYFYCANPSQ